MEANSPTLGFLVHDVARLLRKRFEQNARDSGLTRSQWQGLAHPERDEGIHQSGGAGLVEVETNPLGRIGHKRRPHATDRRIWLLHLTDLARPKLKDLRELGDLTRGEALAGVSEEDREHLVKTLQMLKANLIDASSTPVQRSRMAGHA